MSSADQNPKLPMWIFYVADAALLAAAWFIASRSAHPLSSTATLAIVACVVGGAIVALVPLVARFERQKNELLDERQRALEALARTVSASAEQISIAANGLHQIAELAQKNLRHAEQLPHKLQEKIAEFQAQVANSNDAEKEELERELATLRSSESERLDSISSKIAKSAAEWAKVEAATHHHLTSANEAISRLASGTATAIQQSQSAAEGALREAHASAARAIGEASGSGIQAIQAAKSAALADFESKLSGAGAALAEDVIREVSIRIAAAGAALDAKISVLEAAAAKPVEIPVVAPGAESAVETPKTPEVHEPAPPAKRPRKPRAESPESTLGDSTAKIPAEPAAAPAAEMAPPAAAAADEPPPVVTEKIAEIIPVAPDSASPIPAPEALQPPNAPAENNPPPTQGEAPPAADAAVPRKSDSPRKRASKKPPPEAANTPSLPIDEPAPVADSVDIDAAHPGLVERILTSDGATRLLVTAYIGIGNRLFIRGDGPGLSWDKGVPLQFVSIGKWRWETSDATGPVKFKLYKNDETECSALGAQTLDPAHQQEITAAF